MLTRTLALALMALSLSNTAGARVHRDRPREAKIFAAKRDSVRLENEAANEMGAARFFTQAEVNEAIASGKLVILPNCEQYVVSPKLPTNRRFVLPATEQFLFLLGDGFYRQFHQPLVVDSAVRPATVQKSLLRWNRSAAPAYGDRASTHERGTTFDLSKRMTKAQHTWMIGRLLYYRAIGRVLVIEERRCIHIFVKGEQQ